jgi:hypothetical protein
VKGWAEKNAPEASAPLPVGSSAYEAALAESANRASTSPFSFMPDGRGDIGLYAGMSASWWGGGSQSGKAGFTTHTVTRGDNLSALGQKYFNDPIFGTAMLAVDNDIKNPNAIREGRVFRVRTMYEDGSIYGLDAKTIDLIKSVGEQWFTADGQQKLQQARVMAARAAYETYMRKELVAQNVNNHVGLYVYTKQTLDSVGYKQSVMEMIASMPREPVANKPISDWGIHWERTKGYASGLGGSAVDLVTGVLGFSADVFGDFGYSYLGAEHDWYKQASIRNTDRMGTVVDFLSADNKFDRVMNALNEPMAMADQLEARGEIQAAANMRTRGVFNIVLAADGAASFTRGTIATGNAAVELAMKESMPALSGMESMGSMQWLTDFSSSSATFGYRNSELGLVELNPQLIRTAQTTVKQQGATLPALVDSMKKYGFIVEPTRLIDVVRMPDGQLTSLDTTRILAADRAGINIQARLWEHTDLLPDDVEFVSRFISRNGDVPVTFGDAAINRVGTQNGTYPQLYPYGSWFVGTRY